MSLQADRWERVEAQDAYRRVRDGFMVSGIQIMRLQKDPDLPIGVDLQTALDWAAHRLESQ